jgi:hypothetical protein
MRKVAVGFYLRSIERGIERALASPLYLPLAKFVQPDRRGARGFALVRR